MLQRCSAMPHVNVSINGRQYRLGCEEGEDQHLMQLAADLDKRIRDLRAHHGEIGDGRLTIMAALSMADEVVATGARLRKMEAELASLQDARLGYAERAKAMQVAISSALNAAAERVEDMTRRLNQAVADGTIGMG
jgi:cell division protein ZapA